MDPWKLASKLVCSRAGKNLILVRVNIRFWLYYEKPTKTYMNLMQMPLYSYTSSTSFLFDECMLYEAIPSIL
jgi:hypothetical protein